MQKLAAEKLHGGASTKSKLRLVLPVTNIHFWGMRLSPAFVLSLVFVFCAFAAEQASAQSRNYRVEPSSVPNIMVDEPETPVTRQRLERSQKDVQDKHHTNKEAERRVKIPRGSADVVPRVSSTGGLPRTPLLMQPPAVAPYNPPPVNNPSDRVMQLNQSFPLNRGLGNNPTDRDSYLRYNLNR
jgi:hypothetical protein